MGLLSDPTLAPRNKLGRTLSKHCVKICLLLYAAALGWFICLAHPEFNHSTYLSENALSPGLVYPEIQKESSRFVKTLLEELRRERAEHKLTTPHAWIAAKMKQIGLETHVHNFTLHYPYAGGKEYHGKNIYGILRAPRIGSTEGIVFTAPYRPPTSVDTAITVSIPVLLAFADFARRKNYWAKDLVFLVTEQEQLGMHAWLEAYYNGGIDDSAILNCGNLPARAGALQAALNLEVRDMDFDYINVKIEGLNGQLPNLDMFNLVQRITAREEISSGYKQTPLKRRRNLHSNIEENLRHMTSMLFSQVAGIPNGNHGLFHRYRIESLTLEVIKRNIKKHDKRLTVLSLLKTIEGISRSLNNLLERFHQSYFFYILVQNDRFVSIGDYMPCLMLLASTMFIKAFLLWLTADDVVQQMYTESDEIENEETKERDDVGSATQTLVEVQAELPYLSVLLYIGAAFFLGLLCSIVPLNQHVRDAFATLDISTSSVVSVLLVGIVLLAFLLPCIFKLSVAGLRLLHIGALIFIGVALIVVALLNFALGFLLAIIIVPLAILLDADPACIAVRRTCKLLYAFLLNPLVVIYVFVLVLTLQQFSELTFTGLLWRALNATKDAITFALLDCIIYGNWLYTAITAVFFPLWTICWTLALTSSRAPAQKTFKQKIN